MSKLKS